VPRTISAVSCRRGSPLLDVGATVWCMPCPTRESWWNGLSATDRAAFTDQVAVGRRVSLDLWMKPRSAEVLAASNGTETTRGTPRRRCVPMACSGAASPGGLPTEQRAPPNADGEWPIRYQRFMAAGRGVLDVVFAVQVETVGS
jgi:hypothetical protein